MICDDVTVVLHCGLWSGLKCAYEADSLPLSKLRGRGSVHINLPCPLREVERISKWQWRFPRGEVLREVRECASKSGVESAIPQHRWWPEGEQKGCQEAAVVELKKPG